MPCFNEGQSDTVTAYQDLGAICQVFNMYRIFEHEKNEEPNAPASPKTRRSIYTVTQRHTAIQPFHIPDHRYSDMHKGAGYSHTDWSDFHR